MRYFKLLPLPLLMMGLTAPLHAEHVSLPSISVESMAGEATPYAMPPLNISTSDAGDLVKRLPGANINNNGPLTRIAQYRGLFGDRVNVLIDGVRISTAGPNSMDTPLSYLPSTRVADVAVYRGIAPVSSGIETIGGTIMANSKHAEFATGETAEVHGNLTAGYAENGRTRNAGAHVSVANQNHQLQLNGSLDRGDNLDFDGGEILPSQHERKTYGLGYAFQNETLTASLHASHHDTGETGTPALPMDIIYAKGEHYNGSVTSTLANGAKVTAKASYQDSEHLMSNYELRTKLAPGRRHAITDVKSHSLGLAYNFTDWTIGFDTDQSEHNANIYNPDMAMFLVNNYKDIERDRYSIFAEKEFNYNNWKIETGLRLSRVNMNAGDVNTSMIMAPAIALKNAFNSADRKQNESLVDIVFNSTYTLSSELDFNAGVARKERAASYQERYLWLPLESTAGLADGNNYIGNIELETETAYQVELGLDWHTSRASLSPHVFYHHISDYIQGTPNTNVAARMLSGMMAPDKTVLQFNNVHAKLHGFDANWSFAITDEWQLDGTVSYVRGKRRDTGDNLYRIAPLTARTMLSYVQTTWSVGIEAETVASQHQVSAENTEKQTSGYALINLTANLQPTDNIVLSAGVNNLFDRNYENHLGGYNRIANNPNVAQNDRIPGLDRSAYIGVNIGF